MDEDIKGLVKRLRATMNWGGSVGVRPINQDGPEAADALEALAGEVETLRMKLAACGVGALSNTERTIKNNRIGPDSPYWSASLGDVYYIVDKEMEARTERDRLKAALEAIAVKAGTSECGGNYVAAVSLIGDLEQMADAALRAAGDGR